MLKTGEVVAEGWWCTTCGVYERNEDISTQQPDCPSCGCPGTEHTPVKVVGQ